MDNFDFVKWESLLQAGDEMGAKQMLEGVFTTGDLTAEQKGALYAKLIEIDLKSVQQANNDYLTTLRRIIEQLQQVQQVEQQIDDDINLQQVRQDLQA